MTPSRLPNAIQDAIAHVVARAATAVGLTEGPIHAEVRVDLHAVDGVLRHRVARSLRSVRYHQRTLRFGAGISLEEVVLRHALAMDLDDLHTPRNPSGVMMLPIPRAGTLTAVHHRDRALAVPGVVGLEFTIPIGGSVTPLPEGDRYLGFLFARAETPGAVEAALRAGAAALDIVVT